MKHQFTNNPITRHSSLITHHSSLIAHHSLILFLLLLSLFRPLPSSGQDTQQSWSDHAVVTTRYGKLRGYADLEKTWCWKGIPYATPPLDSLRWKAPSDPKSWTGIRMASTFGNSASQILPVIGPMGSEDCLYLNIWRPQGDEVKLPVYVFIHGGGNTMGTAASPDYYGYGFARRSGLLFVTVTYRLGVLGWFSHPAVTGNGSSEDRSGNFGTLDLIKALEWIHENIESFGGDPGNVTIAGESAGAMNVLSLLTAFGAKGLFHHAVSESGLAISRTPEEAEAASNKLLVNLLVTDGKARDTVEAGLMIRNMSDPEINTYFRSKSPKQLIAGVPTTTAGIGRWPTIIADGHVLPEDGYGSFTAGTWANRVPLLIGVNKDEVRLFQYIAREPEPGTNRYNQLTDYQSMVWRVIGLDTVATAITLHPDAPPVFGYRFDWGSCDSLGHSVLPGKMGSALGAHHYAEVPFFLGFRSSQLSVLTGNPYSKKNKTGREKLKSLCMNYLGNFARTGDPNGVNLPPWPQWNRIPGEVKFIVLDAGFKELRLSTIREEISVDAVIQQVKSEIREPEKAEYLKIITGPSPIGFSR
ncbi:MAG: carboxylesterase family protein [Bacteroidota bacterium]